MGGAFVGAFGGSGGIGGAALKLGLAGGGCGCLEEAVDGAALEGAPGVTTFNLPPSFVASNIPLWLSVTRSMHELCREKEVPIAAEGLWVNFALCKF